MSSLGVRDCGSLVSTEGISLFCLNCLSICLFLYPFFLLSSHIWKFIWNRMEDENGKSAYLFSLYEWMLGDRFRLAQGKCNKISRAAKLTVRKSTEGSILCTE